MSDAADIRPAEGFGAVPGPGGTRFSVWAPEAAAVDLLLGDGPGARTIPLGRRADGVFAATVPGARAGTRYRFRMAGGEAWPDPASRFQPDGVHGASEVVDPREFRWSDAGWGGVPLGSLVLYELHVGTFTPEGTFAAAAGRLEALADLGVTAVELMPLADFPGARGWGYDGAALFAPARCYGRPDDLRRFVDRAHALGLAVHVDVVYNHFGPDGAYAPAFSGRFFTDRHATPWGRAVNLDGEGSAVARAFFVDNALHWIREYHADGLRLDATHAMADEGARHFLAEIADTVRAAEPARHVQVVAEDARNLDRIVRPAREGGWGLDAVWSDDFHHQVRVALAGDRDGYFADFAGEVADVAATIRRGWFYTGGWSAYAGRPRGTPPDGIPPERFVFFLQNHDQVGNRAFGDRLHATADPAAWRAATVLALLVPQTPLLFMGQEWGASSPFLFFTDHEPGLGRRVTEGRREEFRRFAAFADPAARGRIPDPQSAATFEASRLDWDEREREPHAGLLRLHRELLRLRRRHPALRAGAPFEVASEDGESVTLARGAADARLVIVSRLRGPGPRVTAIPASAGRRAAPGMVLSSEDGRFAADARPAEVVRHGDGWGVRFARPGAVVLDAGADT